MRNILLFMAAFLFLAASCTNPTTDTDDLEAYDTHPGWDADSIHFFD